MFSHDVKHVALRLMRALDTPRSLSVAILIEAGAWDQVLSLNLDPYQYEPLYHSGVEKYRRDVQATDFLRKCDVTARHQAEDDDIDSRKEQLDFECWDEFLSCERECFNTNRRLMPFIDGTWETSPLNERFMTIVKKARNWLMKVLGPAPSELSEGRFGPGGTFETELWPRWVRDSLTAHDKLRLIPTFTRSAASLWDGLDPLLKDAWGDFPDPSAIVPGDRFATVPKTALKRRPIALGPGLNVFMQLAVNDALVARLSRCGIHIKHEHHLKSQYRNGTFSRGQQLHRELARLNSVSGDAATVDLSSASDLNAYALIQLLFCWNQHDDWFALLSTLRSPKVRRRISHVGKRGKRYETDHWLRLEKFSAMGNGFTFPLETLVFCALLHGVGCEIGVDTFVYGDDMIIPKDRVQDAIAILKFVGHRPNLKKTYTDGIFRESCGGDYLLGHDVRPYFLKEEPHEPASWISLANALWRRSVEWQMPELIAVRNACLDYVPTQIRNSVRGPQALGDIVIWDDPARWCCNVRASRRYFRVWRPVTKPKYPKYFTRESEKSIWWEPHEVREHLDHCGTLAGALMGYSPEGGLSPRGMVVGYRFGRVVYS